MKKPITLNDVIKDYQKTERWLGLAAKTRFNYQDHIIKMEGFADKPLKDITRKEIVEFINWFHETPSVGKIMLTVLRNVINHALDCGYITQSPIPPIRLIGKTNPIPRWTDAELEEFIATAPLYLARTIVAALYTGQRRSDLANIMDCDYDGKFIRVTQQKTGKRLIIPVHENLKQALDVKKPKPEVPYLLWNKAGDKWSVGNLTRSVQRHAQKIGQANTTIHGIRKSTASKLAEAGATVPQIAAITGHSFKEVERYVLEADKVRLAEQAIGLME